MPEGREGQVGQQERIGGVAISVGFDRRSHWSFLSDRCAHLARRTGRVYRFPATDTRAVEVELTVAGQPVRALLWAMERPPHLVLGRAAIKSLKALRRAD